jgi:hypothetical protein
MESTNLNKNHRRLRSPARIALSGLIAVLGLTLTASAALGGFGQLADTLRDHVYCKVVRDCVYGNPPNTRIVAGPKGVTNDRKPVFKFSASKAGVKYRCRMDERPFGACRNPYQSDRLRNGRHVLEVFAIDRTHNADPSPATRAFRVDSRRPTTNVRGAKRTKDRTPSFRLSSNEAGHFEYRLDGKGGFKRSSAKLTLGKQKPGRHRLEVRAVDRAGNRDRSPSLLRFKVVRRHSRGSGDSR